MSQQNPSGFTGFSTGTTAPASNPTFGTGASSQQPSAAPFSFAAPQLGTSTGGNAGGGPFSFGNTAPSSGFGSTFTSANPPGGSTFGSLGAPPGGASAFSGFGTLPSPSPFAAASTAAPPPTSFSGFSAPSTAPTLGSQANPSPFTRMGSNTSSAPTTGAPQSFGGFGQSATAASSAPNAQPFSGFGAPAPATTKPSFSGFGTAPTSFGMSTSTTNAGTTQAPTGPSSTSSFKFGTTPGTTVPSTTPSTGLGFAGFPLSATTSASVAPSFSAPAPAPNFSFGGSSASTASTASAAPPLTTAPSLGLGFSTTTTSVPSTTFNAPSATSTGGPPFQFSTLKTTTNAASVTTPVSLTTSSASVPSLSIPVSAPTLTTKPTVSGSGASTSTAVTTTGAKPSAAGPAPTPSHLRNKTMEEILNGWNVQLDTYTREFNSLASEVAKQDKALIENGAQITRLHTAVLQTEQAQQAITQNLEYIHSQQDDLSQILDHYEQQIRELFETPGAAVNFGPSGLLEGGLQPADHEREKAYALAETLNAQLDDMSKGLGNMIEDINQLGGATNGDTEDDPITQIVHILNAHLTSLQWIDSQTSHLQDEISKAEKLQEEAERGVDRSKVGIGAAFTRR